MPKPRRTLTRYSVDTAAIRRLSDTLPMERLATMLGVAKATLYALVQGHQPAKKEIADKINANLARIGPPHSGVQYVTAALNDRANGRVSVRTSERGYDCRYKVLRYPLAGLTLMQRYDASKGTLDTVQTDLHRILSRYAFGDGILDRLLARGLITAQGDRLDLAEGTGLAARIVQTYRIDLANREWAMLLRLCQESAKRDDPTLSGIVRYHPGFQGYAFRHPGLAG